MGTPLFKTSGIGVKCGNFDSLRKNLPGPLKIAGHRPEL